MRTRIVLFIMFLALVMLRIVNASEECEHSYKWKVKDYHIEFCAVSTSFNSAGPGKWAGSAFKIYKLWNHRKKLIKDFSENNFTYLELQVAIKGTELFITVPTDRPSDWKSIPLFTEKVNLDTDATTIYPLVKLPRYNEKLIEQLIREIDNVDFYDKNTFLKVVYTNFFKLRDFAFYEPSKIEAKLRIFEKRGWNDGEVSEIYNEIMRQIEYIKGKKIVIESD